MSLEQGQVIKDHYRVAKVLGQDGFGGVYRAWDLNMNSSCVLEEVIDPSGGMGRWFERRASQLARTRHNNLPRILDAFSLPMQGHYLVVELIEGQSLESKLGEQGRGFPETMVIPWINPVCDALSYLHDQEPPIYHCAVKPGNIIVTGEDQVMLVGLRVASINAPQEGFPPGVDVANQGYSPPEIYGRGHVQPRSDVYSLGATMYRLLTAERPPESLLVMGKDVPPPESVYEINPQVNYSTSAAIQRAMEIDPEKRFESVESFKKGLAGKSEAYAPAPASLLPLESQPTYSLRETPATPPGQGLETVVFPPESPVTTRQAQHMEQPANPPGATDGKTFSGKQAPSGPPPARRKLKGWWVGALIVVLLVLAALCVGGYFLYPRVMGMIRTSTASDTATLTATLTPLYSYTPTNTNTPAASYTPTSLPTQRVDEFDVTMALVEAGPFIMGSNMGAEDETPAHSINLDAFYIDRYEVTNSQYDECVKANKCNPPLQINSNTHPDYYTSADYANFPVIYVTWEMAKNFCEWRGASLPSEAQWEKAAHGEEIRTFPWGEEADCSFANFWGENSNCVGDTAAVGSYPNGTSPYGIYDMSGNVWEWVLDWYDEAYFSVSPAENPEGPVGGQLRVMRGGSWAGGMLQCRTTTRGRNLPTKGYNYVGFRCVYNP
jgi:formylglycine-generating enzyme required for sulfatase activity